MTPKVQATKEIYINWTSKLKMSLHQKTLSRK
jgi:hypothetical protein